MNKKARIFAITVAILLVVAMLLGIVLSFVSPASAAPSSPKLNTLRQNASALAAERKNIQREIEQNKRDRATAIEQKKAIDQQVENTSLQIETIEALIDELGAEIALKQVELEQALENQARQNEIFRVRVRAMEEAGDMQYLDALLDVDNFSEYLGRASTIQEIMDYDRNLMDEMQRTKEAIEEAKTTLESDRVEQLDARAVLEEQKAALIEQSAEQVRMIEELENEEATYEAAMDAAEKAQNELQVQIDKELKELAAQQKRVTYIGGTYTWPLPGYTSTGSGFGYRIHPVYKTRRMHTGVDVGAPRGTKIVAANGGTVLKAGYNSGGYGNYVVIDHGGGQTTLYAHMSKVLTSVGAVVGKGDTIGLVGSTGVSTGNHLHFEVRVNGSAQDPMKYFTRG